MMKKLCKDKSVYTPEDNDSPWYPTSWGVLLPRYRSCSGDEIPSGLYLALWHGRKTRDEEIPYLGFNGPMIGPLCHLHMFCSDDLWFIFADPDDAKRYFPEAEGVWWLSPVKDMIEFDGCYFGAWSIFMHSNSRRKIS